VTPPTVGISACLTGASVRHVGGHRHARFCTDTLARFMTLSPLCPEVGAGLGVPRPAMQLRRQRGDVRLVARRTGSDHTEALQAWSAGVIPSLATLSGFILMGKSPSCGMTRVRCYDEHGALRGQSEQGLFAQALQRHFPLLPVEEAGRLNDPVLRENFIARVFVYHDWQQAQPLTPAALIAFHTRHKLQLLAHSQSAYRSLGVLLANLRARPLESLAEAYIQGVMAALATPARRGAHVNVLQHIAGYFRGRIHVDERQAMQEQIDAYLRGEVPLVVPVTLLRQWLRRAPDGYLAGQTYLQPYPDALGLRNSL